jgi:hypothetical protein
MKVQSVLAGGAVACGLAVALPVVASANVMWCVGDPPVQMSSADGTNFTVSTQIFTTGNKQHLSQLVDERVTSAPDGHGGTLVTVEIVGPAGTPMTVVASVNKVKVSNQASGTGDVIVTLDVPIA